MSENLTQLATVKARLELPESDVKDDVLLAGLIALVSGRIADFCNRKFGYLAEATYEFSADDTEVIVQRYPIAADGVSKFEVKSSESGGWIEQAGQDFIIRRDCLISLTSLLGSSREQARVTFAGGYKLPGGDDDAEALPAQIDGACVEQVVYLYRNKSKLGLSSVSSEGGAVTFDAMAIDLLPTVAEALKQFRRIVL